MSLIKVPVQERQFDALDHIDRWPTTSSKEIMSRRKQARPIRALKNSKEDEDVIEGEGSTEEDHLMGNSNEYVDGHSHAEGRGSSESDGSNLDTSGESSKHVAMETINSAVSIEPADLSTGYRCEDCSCLFSSVTDLFEHRSAGCMSSVARADGVLLEGESRSTSGDVSEKSHVSDDDVSETGYVAEGSSNTDQQFFLEHRQALPKDCPRPYPCQFCNKTFSRLSFLNRHEQYHDDKMPFKCELCERLFKHKRSRDRHMRLHTGDKKFVCSNCGISFARSDHLKIHLKTPCFKVYTCSWCHSSFQSEGDWLKHQQVCVGSSPESREVPVSQTAPKMYSILTGKEVMLSDRTVPSSSTAHDESQDLTCVKVSPPSRPRVKPLDHGCPFCSSKNFASVESLNSHIQKNHKVNDSNPYTCNLCGKVYPSYYNLVEHISVIHEQDDEEETDGKTSKKSTSAKDSSFYICGYCTMKFASMPSLHEHVKRVHAVGGLVSFIEDGKLVCAHCNAGFPSDVALMDHFRTVHGLQNTPHPSKLPCPQCTKTYPNTKILHEHIRRNHAQPLDRMRYPCPYCLKQNLFDSIEQLQLHVEVIHKSEQEPVFLCPHEECKSHFKRDKDLKIHLKQQHPSPSTSANQQWRESPKLTTPQKVSPGATGLVNPKPPSDHGSISQSDELSTDTHVTCPICKKMFSVEDDMYKHSLVHFRDETLEYACKDCGKLFKRPDELQKHLFEIHAHHLYKCSLCKEIFDCKVSIQVHFAVKHSNETKTVGCIKCGMTFSSDLDLLKHVKVDHLDILNYHKCLFCSHSFSSEVDLQCHLVTHSQVYKCSSCRIPFGSKEAFQEHLDTVHQTSEESPMDTNEHNLNQTSVSSASRSKLGSEEGSKAVVGPTDEDVGQEGCFVCQICDDKFPLKMLLDLHHQSKHNLRTRSVTSSPASNSSPHDDQDSAKYSCVICSRVFASRQKVLDHVHSHASKGSSPDLPSASPPACVCHFCQRAVKSESDFMWHTQVHQTDISTPTSQVRCIVCLQLLPPSELAIHVQFHLPVPFAREACMCYICGRTHLSRSEVTPRVDELGRPYYICFSCNQRPIANGSENGSPPLLPGSQDSPTQSRYSVRCHKCNVKFETQAELASHLPTHQTKTYQCIKCQRTFGSEAEIKLHVTSHVLAEGIMHECKLCHMVLDSPAKLQCHLIEHTFSSRDYACPICKAVFATAQDIQGHAIEHGMDARQHLCTQCNQAFFFSAELENHLLSRPHHQETSNSFQCGDCSLICSSLAELGDHMKSHQTRPMRYRCSVCDESFSTSDQVQQHYLNHHSMPKEKPSLAPQEYQCFYCDKTFPGVSNLQGHMKVHSDGKKYTCPECSKVFALERNLTVHMRSHNSEKPYQCPICEKRFARKEHRKIHIKSHSGFKAFVCHSCDKTFARKIQLREHMRSHSGQALKTGLHRCEVCCETFTLSKNLRRHKKRVHKVFKSSGSASTSSQSPDEDAEKGSSLEDMDVASAEVTSSQDLEQEAE